MSELREQMIADMRSQGLSAATQEVYLRGVKGLAAYYRRSPDQLDEKEVRGYLLYLRDERGVARGTYMPHQGGIRFLFAHTLDRDWPLFLKKESARPRRDACLTFSRMQKRARSFPASGTRFQEPRCF
jgi:integrase/recombinase XerD